MMLRLTKLESVFFMIKNFAHLRCIENQDVDLKTRKNDEKMGWTEASNFFKIEQIHVLIKKIRTVWQGEKFN